MDTYLAQLAPLPLALLLTALLLLLVAWAHRSGWTNPENWPRSDVDEAHRGHPLLRVAGGAW